MNKIGIIGKGNFSLLLQDIFKQNNISYSIYDHQDSKKQLKEILKCKYLILAIPVQYIEDFISNINKKHIIIDICSVKEYPKNLYKKNKINAILTHPMFGPNSVKEFGLEKQKIMLDFELTDKLNKDIFLDFIKKFKLKKN